jgi:hypothetical protein
MPRVQFAVYAIAHSNRRGAFQNATQQAQYLAATIFAAATVDESPHGLRGQRAIPRAPGSARRLEFLASRGDILVVVDEATGTSPMWRWFKPFRFCGYPNLVVAALLKGYGTAGLRWLRLLTCCACWAVRESFNVNRRARQPAPQPKRHTCIR